MDQKLHGHPDHNVVTMEMLHCHMFSLSLGNIVMSVDNGRNEPNLYVLCHLHALFSLTSISHDHLDGLSSTIDCLSDPPINSSSSTAASSWTSRTITPWWKRFTTRLGREPSAERTCLVRPTHWNVVQGNNSVPAMALVTRTCATAMAAAQYF